jgi:hypothetical protein
MRKTDFGPMLAHEAPGADTLTDYDEEHLITYRGLLDAEREGAEWDEAALLVLCIDPIREPARARRAWETHLARAKWLVAHGYGRLLYEGVPS